MATSRDIQELVSKLSSDKVKVREEGIRLLNSWMDGDRSVGFCKLLASNTARIDADGVPSAETWPFLVSLLTKCVMMEISSSKKRFPKLIFAKTLRIAIQRAENSDPSGKLHPLMPIVKSLFNHICDVVRDVPIFQAEYGIILRQLLVIKEYRVHMKKQVYCSLVHLYISKVEAMVGEKGSMVSNTKEESFRWVLTFHSLLENSPGDFPKVLRDSLTNGFISIFSHIKEEGKISRKLLECVNMFLIQDGPNLGSEALKIHYALQDFISCIWFTTRDRSFKNALVLYAKIQLKLRKDEAEESPLLQQFFDMVVKELDQDIILAVFSSWDDKGGIMASSQKGLMELAAYVIYKVCVCQDHETSVNKRPKRETAADCVKESLTIGKWLWYGAFCSLIEKYGDRINNSLIAFWFAGICENVDRILSEGYKLQAYDGLLWVLRALHGLSSLQSLNSQSIQGSSVNFQEVGSGWHTIWSCLIHWLPVLCNVAALVDASFLVLGNIILNDLVTLPIVPHDVWDLQALKENLSVGALYFITQYFAKGLQGDLRDILDLRQKLLKAVLGSLNLRESLALDGVLIFLPAAIFSLSSGCFVLPPSLQNPSMLRKFMKFSNAKDDKIEMNEHEQILEHELFECSIEILSRIYPIQDVEAGCSLSNRCFHLEKLLRQKLLIQVEDWLLVNLDIKIDQLPLHDLLLFSAFLFTCAYSYTLIREEQGTSIFLTKMYNLLVKYLHQLVSIIDGSHSQVDICRVLDSMHVLDSISSVAASSQNFTCSPLFSQLKKAGFFREFLPSDIIQMFERFLFSLAKLFEKIPRWLENFQPQKFFVSVADADDSHAVSAGEARVMDMDLDVDIGAKDDSSIVREGGLFGISHINLLRRDIILAMSKLSNLLPGRVTDILLELLKKESDPEVHRCIFHCLCETCICSSSERIVELAELFVELVNASEDSKNISQEMLTCMHCLLCSLVTSDSNAKNNNVAFTVGEQNFILLGNILNNFADSGRLHWVGRVELVDCICCFIMLVPQIGQGMIEKLLAMVQDADYRVRLFLARRIGVLFQTWDGHQELFQDICLSFGVKIVTASKENLVTASEVLAIRAQSHLALETTLVILGHVAFVSEIVEVEAVFMICASAAVDPSLRKLAYFLLSNLSRRLNYDSREKYLDELLGSLISSWITCGVSLVGLVEVRDLFVANSEAGSFLLYCCPWLLPPLILNGKTSDLQWVSMVASEPVAAIVRKHFIPVFAVCMALHCCEKHNKDDVAAVLRSSILQIADISENERDGLIKKHMVSIVSCLLSLCSSASDPVVPFFTVQTIVSAIRTVVDGFLEIDDPSSGNSVVDKIDIFRPDRVFKFLLDIHYQITGAVHPRHRCHKLASIEALINVLGERAIIPSTSFYIFNIATQLIDNKALHRQCCHILSILIRVFQNSTLKEKLNTLGEQLQFVVSKLVACCIPSKGNGRVPTAQFSGVLSILHHLIVDADCSLHEYIKDLEPFPELDCFEQFRVVQQKVCKSYSPKDHLLNFVGKSRCLSHKFLHWSLEALHKKLLSGELFQLKKDQIIFNSWCSEPEIVSAVWMLVGMCGGYDWVDIRELLADFISRIGIVDPHHVVFHLPYDSIKICASQMIAVDIVLSNMVLAELLALLKKYLMDDSVNIIDLASRTLQGILSTERGQAVLQSFACFDRSLLKVHSKGVSLSVVDKLIHDVEKASKVVALEDCSLWNTSGKSYDQWLCPLVHSLIGHTDDVILRLCQEMVLMKVDVAEFLFPIVLANLAQRKETSSNLRQLVSSQVQDYIFTESNKLLKSIQLMLNALNMLRKGYITAKLNTLVPHKREGSKLSRSSGCCSRSRVALDRSKDSTSIFSEANLPSSEKVYWFSIDYLAVAKAAIHCGSYFTAVLYVEHWCEERYNGITIGEPDFSPSEVLSPHIELLVAAIKHINEPDGIYGIIRSHKLTLQSITYEHEGNWRKAIECYDLLLRTESVEQLAHALPGGQVSAECLKLYASGACDTNPINQKFKDKQDSYKGLMRCLQQNGCTHILDLYRKGLTSQRDNFQQDPEFVELQYEAAWRAGNWDFSFLSVEAYFPHERQIVHPIHFHENLHSCLRALQDGDWNEFSAKLSCSKQELVLSICQSSKESTEKIYTAVVRLQILDHLGMAWGLRWPQRALKNRKFDHNYGELLIEPVIPSMSQMELLTKHWDFILEHTQFHLHLLEPFIAFRRALLQILDCKETMLQHLLQSATTLRKGSRLSQALAVLHELKSLSLGTLKQQAGSYLFSLGRLEEAKLLRAQGQQEMAINLAKYILHHHEMKDETSNVYRLVGKWLSEMGSSNSRTILEQYLKQAVELVNQNEGNGQKSVERKCRTYFHLAHFADALFRSYEERLASSEWQAAMRLRRHKTKELEALIKRLRSLAKAEKTDYSMKIQELQKQLSIDEEEAERLQDDRDHFLDVALTGYQRCLVAGDRYDLRVVFRLVSLWFSLCSRLNVISSMLEAVKEIQSYKFLPLVYQIASRMGSSKDSNGSHNFQYALVSLVKKMAVEHPYHTIFQLLALANGDRVKNKQQSRNSFVVDLEKKYAAENLLKELSTFHGNRILQMKQMVETYIKLAELETKKEDTNKKITLPREIRCLRQLELVPVVTASFPVDYSCQYVEGSFPHFTCLSDTVTIMNGINAPKVVECFGSNGQKYRQLAKSGNDDLRQDAVMEQFFGLVNTFLLSNRDTWKRRLRIRTYKVVPFTPSAGVLEWVDGTIPLGEYLLGSNRNGGAHGRYGIGDWTFLQCREYMTNEKDKHKSFEKVCDKFRPVMHHFFLERYLQPPQWFEKRLSYTRSVAASSMVGYIVGLGDRHSMNILIDEATAEVVHIDLGVAFEQGLMLKTPERVPFRLTRDIIDGMGVMGVEGVFRRCCEETLSVMRTNKEALLTIIEVFIHDPLYKWALSPLKALQRQKETDDDVDSSLEDSQDVYEGNKDAARALMRVKQKLDGFEEGEMRSVQGQVQQLIQNAVDADRLCQMFPGWGAWL